MADCSFLPVDALALQQLKRRAQTAHSNFIVDDLVLTMSSNRPQVGYSSCVRSISLFFDRTPGEMSGQKCTSGAELRAIRPLAGTRARPKQHVGVT